MAIDSAAKRAASLGSWHAVVPDGTLSAQDRAAITGTYLYLSAPVPIAVLPRGYLWLVEDMVNRRIIASLDVVAPTSYDEYLCRAGSMRGTLSLDVADLNAEVLREPGRFAIYAVRNGRIEWGGPWVRSSLPSGSDTVTISALGWLWWLARRRVRTDRTFDATTDQFTIVETLVADAQDEGVLGAGADLGITVTYDALSGVKRERLKEYRWFIGKTLEAAIQELANAEDGFDYQMRYEFVGDQIDKSLHLSYPQQGTDYRGQVGFEFSRPAAGFEYERNQRTNVLQRGLDLDASKMAWRVRGWGAGQDEARLFSDATDETRRGAYPFYDDDTSHSSDVVQATLDENTVGDLSRLTRPTQVPSMVTDPDLDPKWETIRLGDIFEVTFDDGWASLSAGCRIVGYHMDAIADRPTLYVVEV